MNTVDVPLKGFKATAKIRVMSEDETRSLLSYIGDYDANHVYNQLIYLYVENYISDILTLIVRLTPKQRTVIFEQLVDYIINYNKTIKLRRNKADNSLNLVPQEAQAGSFSEMAADVVYSQIGTSDISENVKTLSETLKEVIVGQDQIIDELQTYFECSLVGTRDTTKPRGSVLFVGDTGTGKTYTAKEIAKHLWGSHWRDHFFVINGSEFMASHETSKLIGSPPGYVGHNDKPAISKHFAKHPDSILLVDEFEKANNALQDLFLHILDEGYMNDSKGDKIDFTKAFIIFTSNIGTKEVLRKNPLGFTQGNKTHSDIVKSINSELKEVCRPEFLKRFDETFVFRVLEDEEIVEIVKLEVKKLTDRVRLNNPNLDIAVEEPVYRFIFDSLDDVDGPVSARDIAYAVRKKLEIPVAKCLLSSERDKKLKVFMEADDKIGVNEEEIYENGKE